jgi:drug/metabolite transporter (DMT)-like permease
MTPSASGTDEHDTANTLFDLRWLIGALFAFYGVVLVIASFFVSTEKSQGVDINLWLGLAMFLLGAFFLVWARLRPLVIEGESALAHRDQSGGPPVH